jgi:hypothetical protein
MRLPLLLLLALCSCGPAYASDNGRAVTPPMGKMEPHLSATTRPCCGA